jgi:hypothetical protein
VNSIAEAVTVAHEKRIRILREELRHWHPDDPGRWGLEEKIAAEEAALRWHLSGTMTKEDAIRALWALWNDFDWLRYKSDYLRGHLSYADMLEEREKLVLIHFIAKFW